MNKPSPLALRMIFSANKCQCDVCKVCACVVNGIAYMYCTSQLPNQVVELHEETLKSPEKNKRAANLSPDSHCPKADTQNLSAVGHSFGSKMVTCDWSH